MASRRSAYRFGALVLIRILFVSPRHSLSFYVCITYSRMITVVNGMCLRMHSLLAA